MNGPRAHCSTVGTSWQPYVDSTAVSSEFKNIRKWSADTWTEMKGTQRRVWPTDQPTNRAKSVNVNVINNMLRAQRPRASASSERRREHQQLFECQKILWCSTVGWKGRGKRQQRQLLTRERLFLRKRENSSSWWTKSSCTTAVSFYRVYQLVSSQLFLLPSLPFLCA